MKSRILLLSTVLFLAISLSGCDIGSSSEQTCTASGIGTAAAEVSGEEGGTTTIAVGETVTFNVSFKIPNLCYSFDRFFQQNIDASERQITVNTKYDGCNCEDQETTLTKPYSFTPTTAGNYILKFKKSNTEYFVRNVTVTE